ncbi:hypothetical protein [Flavobacterium muglaense]|uniref:Uncharacterized protein n=1 Tax=Flavobacterium muglaense TaxID=2764716 RepID=A0A923MZB8_9FLAO|nr:hypothetical protein [Flavobacterium muglaense]MBC5836775.1 hypothetical protein [Flavobacterium muglaense]MBC5843275.1 hypothetical protein [Flavobacterium muglaense]
MIPKAILNKVTKLNEMIASHIDSDGGAIGVIDTNGTWQAPTVYSIVINLNSIRIDSYDVYVNETKVYDSFRFNKSNPYQQIECNETLNDLIKQYRKSIKSLN